MDKQLKTQLVSLLESDISLGYYSQSQKQCLEKNVGVVVGALCFFGKHWRKFLNADFPHVPNGKHSGYLLLECLSRCSRVRKKSSTEILTLGLLANHIGKISALDWSPFKRASRLKVSLSLFKDEIEHIRGILYEMKQKMVTKNCLFNPQPQSSRSLSAFKSLANFAELDEENGEFFVPIPRSTTKQGDKKKRGKLTMKQTFIVKAIVDITNVLKFKEDYVPMFLDDENMGINDSAFAEVGGTITLDAGDRAYYRQEFKKKLTKGLDGVDINLFGRLRVGSRNPSCLCLWKVPLKNDETHAGMAQKVVDKCREKLPKVMTDASARHFDNIMSSVSDVPSGVRKAIKEYLFMGEANMKGVIADEYCQYVMNLAAGMPVDKSFIIDGRTFNSRSGKGIGTTK